MARRAHQQMRPRAGRGERRVNVHCSRIIPLTVNRIDSESTRPISGSPIYADDGGFANFSSIPVDGFSHSRRVKPRSNAHRRLALLLTPPPDLA
jgi:hypothetical protein